MLHIQRHVWLRKGERALQFTGEIYITPIELKRFTLQMMSVRDEFCCLDPESGATSPNDMRVLSSQYSRYTATVYNVCKYIMNHEVGLADWIIIMSMWTVAFLSHLQTSVKHYSCCKAMLKKNRVPQLWYTKMKNSFSGIHHWRLFRTVCMFQITNESSEVNRLVLFPSAVVQWMIKDATSENKNFGSLYFSPVGRKKSRNAMHLRSFAKTQALPRMLMCVYTNCYFNTTAATRVFHRKQSSPACKDRSASC